MRSLFSLLLFFPFVVNAADRLQGSWHSDLAESKRFYEAHSLLEPRQSDFLNGVLGHLQIDISDGRLLYTMPNLDVQIQGKSAHFVGEHVSCEYQLLGADQDSVVILVKNDHGKDRIWHLHFVTEDLFWIYSEDANYGLRDLNFREYFRRAK